MADWTGEVNSWALWLSLALMLLVVIGLIVWIGWRGVVPVSNVMGG